MYPKINVVLIFMLVFVYSVGSENLAEESFQAYRNAVYPADSEIGSLRLGCTDEEDGILCDVIYDLRKGTLSTRYLNRQTQALTLANYQELRSAMPRIMDVRVGEWLLQAEVVSLRLRLLGGADSRIVELLFNHDKSLLLGLFMEADT